MSAESLPESSPELPPPPEGEDLIDQVIGGRYRIVRVIGRGGMGIVFEALHQDLGARYAVKVLSRTYAKNDQVVARFFREARTVAQLGHAHIVAVHDLGELPDGRPYLTMDLVSGQTLKEMAVARGVLLPGEVADLLGGVADALGVVHGRGIVHRDIKLENIMLAEQPEGAPLVKLLDFGVAAVIAGDGSDSRITQNGWMVGTPLYLPPEAGLGAQADPRWDVYSLGVVAYALLTARWPFDGDGPMVVMSKKMALEPPPLSMIEGTFTPRVEEVVGRALARDPDVRFRSARAFVDALAAASRPDATPLDIPPLSARALATVRIKRRAWPFAAMVWAGVAAVLMGLGLWMAQEDRYLAAVSLSEPVVVVPPDLPLGDPVEPRTPLPGERPVASKAPVVSPQAAVATPSPLPKPEGTPEARPKPAPVASPKPRPSRSPVAVAEVDPTPTPRVPSRDPLRAQALTAEAMRAIVDGMLPRAITLLRDATLADPDHAPRGVRSAWPTIAWASPRRPASRIAATSRTAAAMIPPSSRRSARGWPRSTRRHALVTS